MVVVGKPRGLSRKETIRPVLRPAQRPPPQASLMPGDPGKFANPANAAPSLIGFMTRLSGENAIPGVNRFLQTFSTCRWLSE
jgi:hypothetical protein